jgi:uncharacterized repeat protein (TIGR03803 family)
VLDAAGNLFGENGAGGSQNFGYVFELSPSSAGWSLTDLHDFSGGDGDATQGVNVPSVILDGTGNLFGVTGAGGTGSACSGRCGVIFELRNNSGTWTETVLHSFDGSDGANPNSSLLMDSTGNLYGSATGGGKSGLGVAFKFVPASGDLQILHNFTGVHLDGAFPNTPMLMDSTGNLFGTTVAGGAGLIHCTAQGDAGCGSVFELSPDGDQWKTTIFKAFSGGRDGAFPGGVIFAGGKLLGVANAGGRLNDGLVFEITP